MSYEVKSKGYPQFRGFDLMCEECGNHKDLFLHREEFLDADGNRKKLDRPCDNCEDGMLVEVMIQAPSKISRDGTDDGIAKMQQSFRERFIKKDVDDVRHKFGKLYDDGVRSAAASRIKKGKS
jgi:hypothetical protein